MGERARGAVGGGGLEGEGKFTDPSTLGDVIYDVTGFLDKNKDTLQKDLLVLVEGSKNPFMQVLFPTSEGEVKTSKKTISG